MQTLVLKDIGGRVRKQREFLGYTREHLAEMLEITPKFCSDIELGVKGMSIQTLSNISHILKMSTDYILFGTRTDHPVVSTEFLNLLRSCPPDKFQYVEEVLKSFLMALD